MKYSYSNFDLSGEYWFCGPKSAPYINLIAIGLVVFEHIRDEHTNIHFYDDDDDFFIYYIW